MAAVKVVHDPVGRTLTVWFGNPADESISEETREEIVLMKDKAGHVIGFEKLNFSPLPGSDLHVDFKSTGH